MRGKPGKDTANETQPRITPADAGKTVPPPVWTAIAPDHPRGCGENLFLDLPVSALTGSPPRMRGKQPVWKAASGRGRITPADAGKTLMRGCKRRLTTDHPRGCGENFADSAVMRSSDGSPPRMRGKRREERIRPAVTRITPADAGKTFCLRARKVKNTDHPRGCGENVMVMPKGKENCGSPPRMRGKRMLIQRGHESVRITPADAGKTITQNRGIPKKTDHPRGCGENVFRMRQAQPPCGSPPRMRGKPSCAICLTETARITPADAGKTLCFIVHAAHMQGSPPRMRGKRPASDVKRLTIGITPADAGKTFAPKELNIPL